MDSSSVAQPDPKGTFATTPPIIGVSPARERTNRRRLFDALERAYNVRFEGRDAGSWRGIAAAVVFSDAQSGGQLSIGGVAEVLLERDGSPGTAKASAQISFPAESAVGVPLRGRVLDEKGGVPVEPPAGFEFSEVVAYGPSGPVWVARADGSTRVHEVSGLPAELGPDERLKDRLQAGHFLSLLPLVHLIRSVSGEAAWQRPAVRATFMIDDPNLHWPTYGFVRYEQLARDAAETGSHVAVAMIPLDTVGIHSRAASVFRGSRLLSLLMHGNNHTKEELGQPRTDSEALVLAAQAWRRIDRLERRHDLVVSRVMVPPHALCSFRTKRALLSVGFEAVCHERPLKESVFDALDGWLSPEVDASGLPRLGRLDWHAPVDEMVLRAYLDHPIVLVAHHGDMVEASELLSDVAARVNSIGAVRWGSATELVRSGYFSQHDGPHLRIRVQSRRVDLDIPAGIDAVQVDTVDGDGSSTVTIGSGGALAVTGTTGSPIPISWSGPAEIRIANHRYVDPYSVPVPRWAPWPPLRRAATETRDRLQPMLHRAARHSPTRGRTVERP